MWGRRSRVVTARDPAEEGLGLGARVAGGQLAHLRHLHADAFSLAAGAQVGLDHEALGAASDEHEEAAEVGVAGAILTGLGERKADQVLVRERQSEVGHVANSKAIRTAFSRAFRTALER